MKLEKIFSIFIILFWGMCLFQLPQKREDYPFSYFGMYKARISPGPYQTFKILIFKNEQEISSEKRFDPYIIFFELRKIFMDRVSLRNRDVIFSGNKVDKKINFDKYNQFEKFIHDNVVIKYQDSAKDSVRIKINYLEWDHLSYETFRSPTRDDVIFDEIYNEVKR